MYFHVLSGEVFINKKIIIFGVGGVLFASMVGSFVGNLASKTSDSKIKTMTEDLRSTTSDLVNAMNQVIPVVDSMDDNVKKLTVKIEEVDFSRTSAIEIHGMEELMTSVKGLVSRVTGMDAKVDSFGVKLDADHAKISKQISKIKFGKMNYFRTKDGAKLESFDPALARRVLCVNRTGRVKCLPSVSAELPRLSRGYIKECIIYQQDLHCGVQKKFN